MAGKAGRTLTIYLAADTSKATRNVEGFGTSLKSTFGPAMAAAGAAAGVFAVKLGVDAVSAASDLNETLSKSKVIFGESAVGLEKWAATADTAMGLSKQAALDAVSTFGQLGNAAGLSGADLATFSTGLAELAADMASFSNTSVQDAINALGSGLRGEAEPLRQYGVLLDDAALKAEALKMGIYDGNGALTQQQKVLAAQSAIMAQTSKAQGDFARTSTGLANQTRILSAQFDNLKVALGQSILRGMGGTESATKTLSQAIEDATPIVEFFGEAVGGLINPLAKVAGALGKVVGPLGDFTESVSGGAVGASDLAYALNPLYWGLKIAGAGADAVSGALDNMNAASAAAERASAAVTARYEAQAVAAMRAAFASNQLAAAEARTRAVQAAGDRYTAMAVQEYGKSISFTGGNLATYMAQLHQTAAATSAVGSSSSSAAAATDAHASAMDRATARAQKHIDKLNEDVDALNKAKDALQDYADSLTKTLSGGTDLAGWTKEWEDSGRVGALADFINAKLQGQVDFANLLGTIPNIANTPGGQQLIQSIASMGPVAGTDFINQFGITALAGLATTLDTTNAAFQSVSLQWANVFYGEGVKAAEAMVEGMEAKVVEDEKRLRKLGKAIGEPIGEAIKSAITNALNDAMAAVGAASTASGARSRSAGAFVVTGDLGSNPLDAARQIDAAIAAKQSRLGVR